MSDNDFHRLLRRQLKKSEFDQALLDDPKFSHFLSLINSSYKNFDEERKLGERAEKLSGEELKQINLTLVEKNHFLDSFNHGLAHDAKNHTANLKGLLKMFDKYNDNKNPEKLAVITERLYRSVNQMNSLLDGFLFLSSGRINVEEDLEDIDDDYLKESVLLEIDYLISGTEHVINFELELEGLKFSQAILKIILVNLISNALKFSKVGVPNCINVNVTFDESNVILVVKDTGIGMDLNDQNSTMFKMFDRRSNTAHIKGFGVGLYLIKSILDKNNGAINIESELRKGTQINIILPKKNKGK